MEKGDIVQIKPSYARWDSALLIVTDVKEWGVMGYIPYPQDGDRVERMWMRLSYDSIRHTGGKATWIIEDKEET